MKGLLATLLTLALFATPSFAAKKSIITLPETLGIGSTQLKAGEYKLVYDGDGPQVKVTLTRGGGQPIVLNAKLVPARHDQIALVYSNETVNGFHVLQEIDLSKVALVFESQQQDGN